MDKWKNANQFVKYSNWYKLSQWIDSILYMPYIIYHSRDSQNIRSDCSQLTTGSRREYLFEVWFVLHNIAETGFNGHIIVDYWRINAGDSAMNF